MYGLTEEEVAEVMATAFEIAGMPAADRRQALRDLLDVAYAHCANRVDAAMAGGTEPSPLPDRTWQSLRALERYLAEGQLPD
jgi:hypothetical protein